MSIATYDLASLTYDSATTDYDGGALGLSNMPVVGVFISFTDGPYVADPNWVEVTQYVRDINVRRGRGNDLQQFPSGSANLTLDNRTRIFDPFNTAGIYYGNLKPRRQIKIVGQYNSITYPIFRGFIAGWPVGYSDGGKDSTVQIDCFDALGLLAAEKSESSLEAYIDTLSPVAYWKCDENVTQTSLKDTYATKTAIAAPTGFPAFIQVPSTARGFHTTAAYSSKLNSTTNGYLTIEGGAAGAGSVSFWAQGQIRPGLSTQSYRVEFTWEAVGVIFSVAEGVGNVFATAKYGSNTRTYTDSTTTQIAFSTPVHVVINRFSSLQAQVFVNGVLYVFDASSSSPGIAGDTTILFAQFEGCAVQHVSMHNRVLTQTEITTLYQFGQNLFNDTTSGRTTKNLATSSFPSSLTSVETTAVQPVADVNDNLTILQKLQSNAISEGGEVYVDSSGVVSFVDREYFGDTRSAVSQVSFTDTGTGVYYDHANLRLQYDADQVRNSINIQFSNDANYLTIDPVSVASYGAASEDVQTILGTPDSASSLGLRLVTIYKNPKLRVEPFMVKGQRNPTYDFPLLLSLELLDRFNFVRTPSTGSAISQDMLLQSIEHRITPGTWETVVNGSARFTGWFIIGTSLIGGTDVLL